MIIFWKNTTILIFIITVLFAKAVESTIGQDNETIQDDPGSPASTTGSQTNSGDITPEGKRQKTSSSDTKSQNADPNSKNEKTPKITEIPQEILDFFNEAKFPVEARLDSSDSYAQSNDDSFKRLFFDFQTKTPFMIGREKFKEIGSMYYAASSLIEKPLKFEDLIDPLNTHELNKYMRTQNISKNDFNRYNYYDWWFSSTGERKKLFSACPQQKESNIKFPTGKIIKTITDEQLENTLVEEDGNVSSDEDENTTSPSRSNSKNHTSNGNEMEGEIPPSSPASSNESDNSDQSPKLSTDIVIETKLPPSIPTAADGSPKSHQSSRRLSDIEMETILPPSSPTSANQSPKSDKSNRSPTRSTSSLSEKMKKQKSRILNTAPIRTITNVTAQLTNWQSSEMNEDGNPTTQVKNTFKGRMLKIVKDIKKDAYMASDKPCKYDLKPSFVKEELFQNIDAYYAGYLVNFGRNVKPLYAHLVPVSKKTMWFHIAHLMADKQTKDTFSIFSYTTFYESIAKMKNIPVYTDYTVNENSHADVDYYKRMYGLENQENIFKTFKNYEKYFDPSRSLMLVPQELMDQKSVPLMTHKRVAMDYMNIAPMYKIIKDITWSEMENVVLKLPMVTTATAIMFITGTYGSLKIGNSKEELYLDNAGEIGGIKRLKVPYAFYKVVHAEYQSPKLGQFLPVYRKFFLSIVIVTHNNPFEKDPKKICDKPVVCASVGWTKVEQKDPALGFTYCCEFTKKFAEKLDIIPMYAGIRTDALLDLRLLWYVETNESTAPLERDEFPLINEKKPVYEIENPETVAA